MTGSNICQLLLLYPQQHLSAVSGWKTSLNWLLRLLISNTGSKPLKQKSHSGRTRKSASGQASALAQQDRIRRMTVEDRIKAALTMSDRYAWLKPVPEKK